MKKTQKNNAAEQTMGGKQASIQEAKGGVQFELVGVPACMDESAQSVVKPYINNGLDPNPAGTLAGTLVEPWRAYHCRSLTY